MYFLLFKRRMRCKATRFNIRMPLWVYEQAIRLEKLHGKNLARVTSLHTLLVLTVLKMLEATSFEKINPVKKWTRMQNKQCNNATTVPLCLLFLCAHCSSVPTVPLCPLFLCAHCSSVPLCLLFLCAYSTSVPTVPPGPLFLCSSVPTVPQSPLCSST